MALGAELVAMTTAVHTAWTIDPAATRSALVVAGGEAVAERAIGVAATFQMMNRLLDGVGAPVRRQLHGIAAELGFDPEDIPR